MQNLNKENFVIKNKDVEQKKSSAEDAEVVIDIKDEKKSSSKKSTSDVIEEIDKNLEELEKKQEEWKKNAINEAYASWPQFTNQFAKQSVIVGAIKDLSKDDIEDLIKEMGTDDFVKTVLQPLMWQAGPDTDKEDLDSIRKILDYEISDNLRKELADNCYYYKQFLDGQKEYGQKYGKQAPLQYWL